MSRRKATAEEAEGEGQRQETQQLGIRLPASKKSNLEETKRPIAAIYGQESSISEK